MTQKVRTLKIQTSTSWGFKVSGPHDLKTDSYTTAVDQGPAAQREPKEQQERGSSQTLKTSANPDKAPDRRTVTALGPLSFKRLHRETALRILGKQPSAVHYKRNHNANLWWRKHISINTCFTFMCCLWNSITIFIKQKTFSQRSRNPTAMLRSSLSTNQYHRLLLLFGNMIFFCKY